MDLHAIDLNLLVTFDALMTERGVTRAGARVGRSQPAVSAALRRLRELLKDELFVAAPGGLQPTPRALELAEPLGRALADIQRALDFADGFDPATSNARFTLALSDHPAVRLLPVLAESLRQVAPGITLNVMSFTARDDGVALLDASKADLVVGVPPTLPVGGRILSATLFTEQFVSIARRGHPVVRGSLDLHVFLSVSHLLVSPENERFGRVDEVLATRGQTRRLGLTLPQMYAAPAIVARSDLVATLMGGVVEASRCAPELQLFPPPITIEPVSFVMNWHRRNHGHHAQRWLRGHIREVAGREHGEG